MIELLARRRGMLVSELPFEKQYLTFEALEDGTFTLSIPAASLGMTSVSYSINNGAWVDTAITANTAATITTPTLQEGDTVRWKGSATRYATSDTAYSKFTSTGNYNVYGNILSLTHGSNMPSTYAQQYLFAFLFGSAKIVDASNLILPTKTGAAYLYRRMFYNCTEMVYPPQVWLTATNGNYNCSEMFRGCTSLVASPDLLLTTVGANCFRQMFYGCTSLKYIKMLATSFGNNALYQWVYNVPSGGTFVKASSATISTGVSGIPSGWTVENV